MHKIVLIIIGLLIIIIFRKKIGLLIVLLVGLMLSIKTDERDYYNPSEDDENWRYKK